MADTIVADQQPSPPPPTDIMRRQQTPPPSPPSPGGPETETKQSRKREREVSLEPATTTPQPSNSTDVLPRERKESHAPVKKNRIQLDSTAEEDDSGSRSRSNSGSPKLGHGSPPQEMKIKVRQISQGVEDLGWRNRVQGVVGDIEMVKAVPIEPASQSHDPAENHSANVNGQRELDTDMGEKGLKRKFLERGTSQGPQDSAESPTQTGPEPLKRPRDDADKDLNPRETKRPSPPPEKEKPAPSFSGGFLSYASTNSPFASVKGQNIFKKSVSPSPEPPSSTATPTKRMGFEGFASTSSPFASVARTKSPILGSTSVLGRNKSPTRRANPASINAFSAYASGGAKAFALPAQKRASTPDTSNGNQTTVNVTVKEQGDDDAEQGESKKNAASFGERLRAGKNEKDEEPEEDVPKLTEQEVMTGEEDEETIHQVRGKLYLLVDNSVWKEKGTGLLKLNVRASDGCGARLVMRKDAVYTLLLNVTLFPGMRCDLAQDPRYLRFSVIEHGATVHYNLRLPSAKIAKELMDEVLANVPTA